MATRGPHCPALCSCRSPSRGHSRGGRDITAFHFRDAQVLRPSCAPPTRALRADARASSAEEPSALRRSGGGHSGPVSPAGPCSLVLTDGTVASGPRVRPRPVRPSAPRASVRAPCVCLHPTSICVHMSVCAPRPSVPRASVRAPCVPLQGRVPTGGREEAAPPCPAAAAGPGLPHACSLSEKALFLVCLSGGWAVSVRKEASV